MSAYEFFGLRDRRTDGNWHTLLRSVNITAMVDVHLSAGQLGFGLSEPGWVMSHTTG